LDPSELENSDGLSSEAVKAQYEAQQEAQRRESQGFQEDLSDMIAAESRKRQKRDEENAKRKKDKYRF
jgi:splicing factor 3B subunit 2